MRMSQTLDGLMKRKRIFDISAFSYKTRWCSWQSVIHVLVEERVPDKFWEEFFEQRGLSVFSRVCQKLRMSKSVEDGDRDRKTVTKIVKCYDISRIADLDDWMD